MEIGKELKEGDQEAHTAGRSPSPAVGQAVSFDKALGSTPSSVVSGLRKHTRSTSLPVGGLQPFFVFFSFFLTLPPSTRKCPSPPKELVLPSHLSKVKFYLKLMLPGSLASSQKIGVMEPCSGSGMSMQWGLCIYLLAYVFKCMHVYV